MKSLKEYISTYKDYPKKGINFKDVLGILQEPEIFKKLIIEMSSSSIIKNADAIISIDARGFIFGSAGFSTNFQTNDFVESQVNSLGN